MTNAICYHCIQAVVGDSASGVELCAKHAATEDLLFACKYVIEMNTRYSHTDAGNNFFRADIVEELSEVIAKVEGV